MQWVPKHPDGCQNCPSRERHTEPVANGGTAAATNVHITAHTTTNQNLSKDSDASTVQTTGTNNLTYLIPKWGTSPVEAITAEAVNECVGSSDLAHLAPRTV